MARQLTLDEFLLKGCYQHAQIATKKQEIEDEALFDQFVDFLEPLDLTYNIPAVLRHISTNKTFQPEILTKIDDQLLDAIYFESRYLRTSPWHTPTFRVTIHDIYGTWKPNRFEGKVFSGGVESKLSNDEESFVIEAFSGTEEPRGKAFLQHPTEQTEHSCSEATPVSPQDNKAVEGDSQSFPQVFELPIP